MAYQIITDATADMSLEMFSDDYPLVIPMPVMVDDKTYNYDGITGLTPKEFYRLQKEANRTSTSQITPFQYTEAFEKVLKEGNDILYIGFTSGLSKTMESAYLAVESLKEQYPNRKIICIDSLCACAGEGLLVSEACRLKREGKSMEEVASWVEENKRKVCHWFTVDDLDHLQKGGRISKAAASIGNLLHIKVLLHVSLDGKLEIKEKIRGGKKAMQSQLSHIKEGFDPNISPYIVVADGNNDEGKEKLIEMVKEALPEAKIYRAEVGPVIGAHTGNGMLCLIYFGNNR